MVHDPSDGVGSDCMLTDVTGTARGNADACFSHSGNDVGAMGALLPHLNTGIFDGITTWSLIGEIAPATGAGTASGTWSVPATGDGIVLSVKSSPEFRAYYLQGGVSETGGTWSVKDAQDLSHLTLAVYAQNVGCPVEDPTCNPASVPEPGTVLLFGTGLAGLGFWRWKSAKKS